MIIVYPERATKKTSKSGEQKLHTNGAGILFGCLLDFFGEKNKNFKLSER
jgi:hypothetical protein